jgi:UDP-N-acetylglucosamine--N-acetylmuramyl-(pentapeptide) pyrophosphoryl-undecaprenol N-acetylglucosamine transferase
MILTSKIFNLMSQIIFIASGGTGGHIIPARCLAQEISSSKTVIFLGDAKISSYVKKDDSFSTRIISSSQLKKSPIFLLNAAVKILFGILQSLGLFLRFRPKYVVAFGGYSTFPILIAAILTRTKIILHEQNAHLGKVNRIFANFAEKIALSFVKTSGISSVNISKTVFVGNPVRLEIARLYENEYSLPKYKNPEIRKDNKMGYNIVLASDFYEEESEEEETFNILVIGGSGGAKIFSEILPKAFFNLSDELKSKIKITQQCRQELVHSTFASYKSFNLNVVIDSFFEDMPSLISESHLVIARSGSSSIFEFCAAKKPMILVPFALSADNHQEKNAQYLEENHAAIVVNEKDFTINNLTDLLKRLVDNQNDLQKMSQNAAKIAVLSATKNLAELLK